MAIPLPPPAVFLIGYRAAGKSTVGRIIAGSLAVPFLDTDQVVEASLGMSIAECFRLLGEAAFRDRESEALRGVAGGGGSGGGPVVATGGGIVLRKENVISMRAAGWVVWLTASAETIRSRLRADSGSAAGRPPLRGASAVDEVAEVLRAREPLYRSAADLEVSTEGRGPEAVAGEVLEWLGRTGPLPARRG